MVTTVTLVFAVDKKRKRRESINLVWQWSVTYN